MKACLAVFRNMKQVYINKRKNYSSHLIHFNFKVEHCELLIDADQLKFQVKLKCRLETVRNATISIVDEENITAAVSVDDTSNLYVLRRVKNCSIFR